MKNQRIRDPLHDLIEFDNGEFEQFLWSLIETREFQRLRRVKQLGFSELVFPGATHTRFLHSVGVFHTARNLMEVIRNKTERFDEDRKKIALTAALVHDIGHGAFSHAFEKATKSLDNDSAEENGEKAKKQKKHESWTSDIITGDTEIGKLIAARGAEFQKAVSDILISETPSSIYAAVVSSQFDADRLDYVRRDRLMTGARHGGFDYSWLLANLEVGEIALATDDEEFFQVESLVLSSKAFQAAESYVLGLFHLYFAVYYHKATRSAEGILTAILKRVGVLVRKNEFEKTGLENGNPLVQYIQKRDLSSYLELDDFVIWANLSTMTKCKDDTLKELSIRLLSRNLYKAIDISNHFDNSGGKAAVAKFRVRLSKAKDNGEFDENEIFEDQATRNPYKIRGHGSPEALEKIHIYSPVGKKLTDLSECSAVVKALSEKSVYRVYVRDDQAKAKIDYIIKGIE